MLTDNTYGLPRPRPGLQKPSYLDGVMGSVVCDLDATVADSYNGSGLLWANLTPNPADGLLRARYDFHVGDGSTASTYPTFNGTPGTNGAYWSADGSDYFRLKTLTGSLPTKWHRTSGGSSFWVATAFRTPPGIFTGTRCFWGNAGSGTNRGVGATVLSTDLLGLVSANGTSAVVTSNIGGPLTGSTDYLYVVSVDPTQTTNNVRIWLNTTTSSSYSMIFGASSTASTDDFFIMATRNSTTNGANAMESGTYLYSFAMGNEFLDNTKAEALFSHLRARHNRAYA